MLRAAGTSIVWAGSVALGLAAAVALPGCTLSSACSNGKITTESLPDSTMGHEYSLQLTESCGSRDAASWALVEGALPPGITLSWDGHLSGTPTATGSFFFGVSLSLTSRGSEAITYGVGSDSRAYTLTVRP